MKIVGRILLVLAGILAALVVVVGILIAVHAPRNKKAMNAAVDTVLTAIQEHYGMQEADCGEYQKMTLYGLMKFRVRRYEVEQLGNLSVMTVNMGVMQMATIVLTPTDKDIPLISADYMYMLGNRTCYLEFYDLVLQQEEGYGAFLDELKTVLAGYSELADVTPSSAWYDSLKTVGFYKKGTHKEDDRLLQLLQEGVETAMVYSEGLPELTESSRAAKSVLEKQYSDGLIENGGISTDVFVKSLGAQKTKEFFDEVLFRTR